jgi:hypothetical protein
VLDCLRRRESYLIENGHSLVIRHHISAVLRNTHDGHPMFLARAGLAKILEDTLKTFGWPRD